MRDVSIHRLSAIHTHDRADSNRGIDRGPELELMGRVGRAFGGDDEPERCGHESSNASARDDAAAESKR
jgi:hypothetical protein